MVKTVEQLTSHSSLTALSLFDKGQQTLSSQRDCVSKQLLLFGMSVSQSVGWTNINKPYAARKVLELGFYMCWVLTSHLASLRLSLPVESLTYIHIYRHKLNHYHWISENVCPKGTIPVRHVGFTVTTVCCGFRCLDPPTIISCSSPDSRPRFSSQQSIDSLSCQSKPDIHAEICQWHDSFGPSLSLSLISSLPSTTSPVGKGRRLPDPKFDTIYPPGGSARILVENRSSGRALTDNVCWLDPLWITTPAVFNGFPFFISNTYFSHFTLLCGGYLFVNPTVGLLANPPSALRH